MAALPDNNIAATQSSNASVAAANPNIFGSSSTPNFNTIGSHNLNSPTQVQLPPPPPPSTTQADATVAGATTTGQQSVDSLAASLTPAPTALDNQQSSILANIASLTGQDAQKGADTAAAENAAGITAKQQAVTDANNELATKTASYNQMQANLGGNGAPETKAVLAAQNAGLMKAQAADIGVTQAKITAANGNLTLAQQQVTNAINLKYSTIEDQINVQKAQLDAIAPLLNQEQKTQALAQQTLLQQQAQQVADQKAKETQINSIAMNAAAAGANSQTLAAISASSDVLSAINAAAPALGAKAASDLKQQAFDNALKLRTAQNDATRVAIEQENANISLAKLQLDTSVAAKTVAQAVTTTPSGKTYVDGTGLDATAKAAAINAGQIVLSGPQQQAMTIINNTQTQFGTLLATLQQNGVDLSKGTGSTLGAFQRTWAAGAATPALRNFITTLTGTNKTGTDGLIAGLSKLPNTGALVATLQNNLPADKDSASVLNTKFTNIKSALDQAENGLLIDNSSPSQINLNGKILNLQSDGTYQ